MIPVPIDQINVQAEPVSIEGTGTTVVAEPTCGATVDTGWDDDPGTNA